MLVVAGIMMLMVVPGVCTLGPGSVIEPVFDSFVVLMICTVPLAGSKASRVDRVGETAIKLGVAPAGISATAGTVSFCALMIFKPPKVNEELTSCEIRTRVLILLGG